MFLICDIILFQAPCWRPVLRNKNSSRFIFDMTDSNSVEYFVLNKDNKISLCLYRNVENVPELKQAVISGRVKAAILNAATILDTFQVLVSARKAVESKAQKKMTTRTIYSEILYNLSPSKNISDSLKKFGLSGDEKDVLMVALNDDGTLMKSIESLIDGSKTSLSELSSCSDASLIKKIYKLSEEDIKLGDLLNSVVTKIATKDIMWSEELLIFTLLDSFCI